LVLVIILGISVGMWGASRRALAQEEAEGRRASSRRDAVAGSVDEESVIGARRLKKLEAEVTALSNKMDELVSTQQAILQRFDAVMEELRVIKVRATLSRGG